MTIRRLTESDVPGALALQHATLEDFFPGPEREQARERMRGIYTEQHLREWLDQPERVTIVAEHENGQLMGFLTGLNAYLRGHIHWVGVDRASRGRGVGSALLRFALREFARENCFLVDAFTNPSHEASGSFFAKFGFEQKAVLRNTLLGSPCNYMIHRLRDATAEEMTTRMIVVGDAGQGIRLLGHVLASVLADLGKEVALNITKPSSVRGGTIAAELAWSEAPISTPFFVAADLLVQLAPGNPPHRIRAKRIIVDEKLMETGLPRAVSHLGERHEKAEVYDFVRHAREDLGSALFTNMIVLGTLLSHMGMNAEVLDLSDELPARLFEKNVEAILLGSSYPLPHEYWAAGIECEHV